MITFKTHIEHRLRADEGLIDWYVIRVRGVEGMFESGADLKLFLEWFFVLQEKNILFHSLWNDMIQDDVSAMFTWL